MRMKQILSILFFTVYLLVCSCTNENGKPNPIESSGIDSSDTIIKAEKYRYKLKYVGCDCRRFCGFTFMDEKGNEVYIEDEILENSGYFICDKSLGNYEYINPYKQKEFLLKFNKSLDDPSKKIESIALVSEVNNKYTFQECGNARGGIYYLTFKNSFAELSYEYMSHKETAIKTKFLNGKSIDTSNYGQKLYILDNTNSKTILMCYNPESDGYDNFCLIKEDIELPPSNKENSNNSSNDKLRDLVNEKISNKYFFNDENGLYTVIHFEPVNDGAPLGAMILSQMKCNFSFTYEIDGNKIDTKFLESGCGRTSTDRTFFYNESSDYIYMNLDGQKFIFRENP